MDIDEEGESISEGSEDNLEDNSEETRNLKVRRYLKSLLQNSHRPSHPPRRPQNVPKKSTSSVDARLSIIPGYTTLVVDTNSSLSHLNSIDGPLSSVATIRIWLRRLLLSSDRDHKGNNHPASDLRHHPHLLRL